MKRKTLIIITVMLFLINIISINALDCLYNTTKLYTFHELNNSIVDSCGVQNGVNGGATNATDRDGNSNSAMNFNGVGGKITIPNNYNMEDHMTVIMWVKFDEVQPDEHDAIWIKPDSGGALDTRLKMSPSSNALTWGISDDSTTDETTSYAFTEKNTVAWYHIAVRYDTVTGNASIFINGTKVTDNNIGLAKIHTDTDGVIIGFEGATTRYFKGDLDDVAVFNKSLTDGDILEIYSNGIISFITPIITIITNMTLTANDLTTSISILNFSLLLESPTISETYQTTNGSIEINYSDGIFNFTTSSNQSGGYYDNIILNYNVSTDLSVNLTKLYDLISLTYSNFVGFHGVNYTRTLKYSASISCGDTGTTTLDRYLNETLDNRTVLVCTNSTQVISGNYTHSTETEFNISFVLNVSNLSPINNKETATSKFFADLFNPTIPFLNFNITGSGFGIRQINANLTCRDTVAQNLTYNLTFNTNNLFLGNLSNNTRLGNTTNILLNGNNTLYGSCSDLLSTTTQSISKRIYFNTFKLIDEIDNVLFDVSNLTSLKVYFDDNSTIYDFKGNGTATVNFTTMSANKLRFVLEYNDGAFITRWIDVSLFNDDELRICANKEGITHFEQFMVSATERPVIIRSIFSNCLVAGDYTRFAYQGALLLKAFTIQSSYNLITNSQLGEQIFLASIDGSVASSINIDQLEFNSQAFTLSIQQDALSFEKTGTSEILIFYENLARDNTALSVLIKRLDTNTRVLNISEFDDPNQFILFFNYLNLNNVTNQTLFQIELTKTKSNGGIEVTKQYFNGEAKSGLLNAVLAFTMSFALMIFGLTFTISRLTFSWFGLLITIGSIAILSFSISTWYITLLMAIEVIIMVYIFLVMIEQHPQTLAG